MKIKHLDLFSGIGGFALACDWLGIENIGFCEIDSFCRRVLNKHWPGVPICEDIANVEEIRKIVTNAKCEGLERHNEQPTKPTGTFDGCSKGEPITDSNSGRCSQFRGESNQEANPGKSDIPNRLATNSKSREPGEQTESERRQDSGRGDIIILTGGFPCQPFSCAGKRQGSEDSEGRYLWPETLAVIAAVRPNWIILENVTGILNMAFHDSGIRVACQTSFCEVPNDEIADYESIVGRIDSDLRKEGYTTIWTVIPAASIGAVHRRDRVWVICHLSADSNGSESTGERGTIREEESVQGIGGTALCSRGISGTLGFGGEGITPNADRAGSGTLADGTDRNWQEKNQGREDLSQSGAGRHSGDSAFDVKDSNSRRGWGREGIGEYVLRGGQGEKQDRDPNETNKRCGNVADSNSGGLEGATQVRRNGLDVEREDISTANSEFQRQQQDGEFGSDKQTAINSQGTGSDKLRNAPDSDNRPGTRKDTGILGEQGRETSGGFTGKDCNSSINVADPKGMFSNGGNDNGRISQRPKAIPKSGNGSGKGDVAYNATDTECQRGCGRDSGREDAADVIASGQEGFDPGWDEPWYEVAQRLCLLHDGLPLRLARYGVEHERLRDKYRVKKLKALGNAIVPQIAHILLGNIKKIEESYE